MAVILLAMLVWSTAGCKQKQAEPVAPLSVVAEPVSPDVEPVVFLRISGEPVYDYELAKHMARLGKIHAATGDVERTEIVLQAVDYVAMRQVWRQYYASSGTKISEEAIQAGFDRFANTLPVGRSLVDALRAEWLSEAEYRENLELNLYKEQVVAELLASMPELTEEERTAFYAAHEEQFDIPDSVIARQIVISDQSVETRGKQARAEEALRQLTAGKKFGDVAWIYSNDASRMDGGRIGRVWRGRTQNITLEKSLFALEPGTFSPIIKSGGDYYIFQVDEFSPGKQFTQEEVAQDIREMIMDQRSADLLRRFQTDMVEKLNIEFLEELQPLEDLYWGIYFPEILERKQKAR